jgi:pimeloyl-ACP methyl ester carboxylesterase
VKDYPVSSTPQTWVGRVAGQDGIIRLRVPTTSDSVSFDLPGQLRFNQRLDPVIPLDVKAFNGSIGEYTDGEFSIVVTMCTGNDVGGDFAFYVDVEHDAAVPLYPIASDRMLSEQGEELIFGEDGGLVLSVDDCEAHLHLSSSVMEEKVSFAVSGSDAVLAGTLLRPPSDGPHPGVVVVHGSGMHQRDYYRLFAHAMVRSGTAVLIYDREGFAESTGTAQPNLHRNAEGVEAALDFMAARDDVAAVGLWGVSNGMWTVPLVAARRPDVAFVAGIGSPGVTMVESETARRRIALRQGGVSEQGAELAAQIWQIVLNAGALGKAEPKKVQQLDGLLKKLRSDPSVKNFAEPDYAVASPRLSPMPPSGSGADLLKLFGDGRDPDGLYDPAGSYQEISCPVLLQYGGEDVNVPANISAERIRKALNDGGNDNVTITVRDGVGHMLDVVPGEVDGMTYEQASYFLHGFRFVPGAIPELQNWLKATVAAASELVLRR